MTRQKRKARPLAMLAAMISGVAKLSLLLLLRAISPLPLRTRYALTDAISVIAWAILAGKRRAARSNLRLILLREPKEHEVLEVFREYGRYWAEFCDVCEFWNSAEHSMLGDQFPSGGKQFLGLTFHMGNFEVFGPALYPLLNRDLTVIAERLQPEFLADHFRRQRQRHRIETITHDDARGILRALKEGKSLGVVCDRSIDGKGMEVTLFGKKTRMPLNVLETARRFKIPVFISYCVKEQQRVNIHTRKVPDEISLDDAVRTVISTLEEAVRKYPAQWHVLSALS